MRSAVKVGLLRAPLVAGLAVAGLVLALLHSPVIQVTVAAADAKPVPTFTKDVAPIFQAKCQSCHRPGMMAPMSLLTYQDARPWARAIRDRVSRREMQPWHLDKTVGIQKFKNDSSLSDEQIATIVVWVDGGAPLGD